MYYHIICLYDKIDHLPYILTPPLSPTILLYFVAAFASRRVPLCVEYFAVLHKGLLTGLQCSIPAFFMISDAYFL
jgi:hypothetical protein